MAKRPDFGFTAVLLAFLSLAGQARGQFSFISPTSPVGPNRGGIRLYSISAYTGYSSISVPDATLFGVGPAIQTAGSGIGTDVDMGGSVTLGWSRQADKRTTFDFMYTSSYAARVRNSGFNSLNQYLSLNTGRSRKLSARWSFSVSGAAGEGDLRSFVFLPTKLTQVAGAPATFDELASAMTAGRFTNDQLASILTGAPVVETPARAVLFGDRLLSASLSSNLTYAKSQRLSINFGLGGFYGLHRPNLHQNDAALASAYLVPRSLGASLNIGVNYSLSPRTTMGFNVSSARSFSNRYDSYSMTGTGTFSRVMGRHWFVQGQAGVGSVIAVQGNYTDSPHSVAGGGLGFKTYTHTVLVSHTRTIGDQYGLGVGSQEFTNATWNWSRPGRHWAVFSSLGYQRLGRGTLTGWLLSSGFGRALSPHFSMQTQYAYLTNSGGLPQYLVSIPQYGFRLSSVYVTAVWTPGTGGMR